MKQQEYLIGDIAAITGLSRDTLRFYEKKGILNARKKANGYRYFTEEDLYLLVRVLFSRKMNFDLDTTRELLFRTFACPDYEETLERQMEEEERAIRFHRQAFHRLLSMKKIIAVREKSLNRFSLKNFPSSRLLGRTDTSFKGLKEWFFLSQKYAGLDMVYLYDCYGYRSGFSLELPVQADGEGTQARQPAYEAELIYEDSCLILYEDVMAAMELECDLSDSHDFSAGACIYTAVEGSDVKPDVSLISAMRRWAADQNLLASAQVFVTSNFLRAEGEDSFYCQEIYIPLLDAPEIQ